MPIFKKLSFMLTNVILIAMWSSIGFSESIEDGYITRTDTPVILKNGSVVKCNSFLWLTKAADFIQCDKGRISTEIKIDAVDIEKTFGPEIAKEYEALKSQLKDGYAKTKEKRKENVVSYKNSPPPGAGEYSQSDEPEEASSSVKKKVRIYGPNTVSNAKLEKPKPIKFTLTPERERKLRAELKSCQQYLKKVKSNGPPESLPGYIRVRLLKNDIFDMTPEEFWKRKIKDIEAKCKRIKRRLEGYIVQEPRSVSMN